MHIEFSLKTIVLNLSIILNKEYFICYRMLLVF